MFWGVALKGLKKHGLRMVGTDTKEVYIPVPNEGLGLGYM